MKKFVLFISMIFCTSLLVSCANMLEGLTTKVETNNLNIPTGTYQCIAINDIENGSVDQERPSMNSMGAIINTDYAKFQNCDHIGVLPFVFLEHGKIKVKGQENATDIFNWRYENERLYITNTEHKVEYIFKHI